MSSRNYYEIDEESGSDYQRLLVNESQKGLLDPTSDSEDDFYSEEKDLFNNDHSYQKKVHYDKRAKYIENLICD